jgi:hypothetical protein
MARTPIPFAVVVYFSLFTFHCELPLRHLAAAVPSWAVSSSHAAQRYYGVSRGRTAAQCRYAELRGLQPVVPPQRGGPRGRVGGASGSSSRSRRGAGDHPERVPPNALSRPRRPKQLAWLAQFAV